MKLKGGHSTKDRRLDRIPQFHDKSRGYPIRGLLGTRPPRSYTWNCPILLDQGQEGACVGFAWTYEKASRPVPISGLNDNLAFETYRLARTLDDWPGESYDGTSVMAGVKAGQQQGFYGEYRWAFGLKDLIVAVGYQGPAVLGINWYESMYETDERGWVKIDGDLAGGHAILARGVNIPGRYVTLRNSWGPTWGKNGDGRISFDDLDRLLNENGEACVPVQRFRPA